VVLVEVVQEEVDLQEQIEHLVQEQLTLVVVVEVKEDLLQVILLDLADRV
jgi:hypothetical protein